MPILHNNIILTESKNAGNFIADDFYYIREVQWYTLINFWIDLGKEVLILCDEHDPTPVI